MKEIGGQLTRILRRSLCDGFGGLCAYCRKKVGIKKGTIDHYLPRALGGGNEYSNLRWCCLDCNNEKGDMHPTEWERLLATRQPIAVKPSKAERRIAAVARSAPFYKPKEGVMRDT